MMSPGYKSSSEVGMVHESGFQLPEVLLAVPLQWVLVHGRQGQGSRLLKLDGPTRLDLQLHDAAPTKKKGKKMSNTTNVQLEEKKRRWMKPVSF